MQEMLLMLKFTKQLLKFQHQAEDLKGKVIDCVEKGYKLGDKIIRYPKVVIGQ